MRDYDLPEKNVSSRDVISAWVLYAVIVFAMIAVSIIHESVATRPAALVESPVVAPGEDSVSDYVFQNWRATKDGI